MGFYVISVIELKIFLFDRIFLTASYTYDKSMIYLSIKVNYISISTSKVDLKIDEIITTALLPTHTSPTTSSTKQLWCNIQLKEILEMQIDSKSRD